MISVNAKYQRPLFFIIGGIINTTLTFLIYLILHRQIHYQLAYFIAYIIGIIFAYWFNSKIVFKSKITWKKLSTYPSIYVVQYLASAGMLFIFTQLFKIPVTIAPLVITATLIPMTYFLNKLILHKP